MDNALQTQLANIQKRTGKTLDELVAVVKGSGLARHGEIVAMLKSDLGMGHGDANTIVHLAKGGIPGAMGAPAAPAPAADGDPVDTYYTGPKAGLRPIHDKLMAAIGKLGEFEIAPKKTYLSLRRKKQFATIGPATNTRVEVGLNMKDVKATSRLEALPPGGMCQYRVKVTAADEVNDELLKWIRTAYDAAG
jgi:Domain of unknown function (DUF5655)/Domain of unknown function (DUF4287)